MHELHGLGYDVADWLTDWQRPRTRFKLMTAYSHHMKWKCRLLTTLAARCKINSYIRGQNVHHFADDIFKYIFLDETVCISIEISRNFVPNGPIDNVPALVQVLTWCWTGERPLSEPMMVALLTHICVTLPQWQPHAISHQIMEHFIHTLIIMHGFATHI